MEAKKRFLSKKDIFQVQKMIIKNNNLKFMILNNLRYLTSLPTVAQKEIIKNHQFLVYDYK